MPQPESFTQWWNSFQDELENGNERGFGVEATAGKLYQMVEFLLEDGNEQRFGICDGYCRKVSPNGAIPA